MTFSRPTSRREPHDALGDEFRMLDDIRRVADHARNEHLALRQLDGLPDPPFVLVTRIGALDDESADLHAEDQIDDVLERHVGRVRPGPASPADVIADAIDRQAGDRVVEHLDLQRQPFAVIRKARRRHHAVVGDRGARVVELQHKAGVDDHAILGAHRRADRPDQLLLALVIFVLAVRDDARRRRDRKERFLDLDVPQRGFEIVDIALELRLTGIGDRPDAHRLDRGRDGLAGIELGVELGETLAIDAAGERIGAGP